MSYTLNVSPESAESLFNDMLVEDFNRLGNEITELENLVEIRDFQYDDLVNTRKYRSAMKTLLGYYLTADQYSLVTGEELYPD